MLSAHEFCIQPLIYDHLSCLDTDNSCSKCKDVGIIVLSGKFSCIWLAADNCTDTFYFISSQRNTNSCTADQDTKIHITMRYCFTDLFSIYRIVTALIRVCSVINYFISFFLQIF